MTAITPARSAGAYLFGMPILLLAALLLLSCNSTEPDPEPAYSSCTVDGACARVGATCKDGSWSTATAQGTCSHHGGVECWRCR
jgi:hypothetical protein